MEVSISSGQGGYLMGQQLAGAGRCPHCSIANPLLTRVWSSTGPTPRSDGGEEFYWGTYTCSVCGGVVTLRATMGVVSGHHKFLIDAAFPSRKIAHEDLPSSARQYLQQAYETLHAPDAATVMAASAVDAMLKEVGFASGSLYNRIDSALQKNILTQGMSDWAHAVRLDANAVRHADDTKPHASLEEARQTVEFAEALGNFLFVLTAKVNRGIQAAKNSTAP